MVVTNYEELELQTKEMAQKYPDEIKKAEDVARIENMNSQCESYIYQRYPQTKQNSDLADKLYYENTLKASGFENLEGVVVSKIKEFFSNGVSFDELLSDVEQTQKEAVGQLLKVAIRVTWVQKCKEELRNALVEDREPNYPEFPKFD